MRRFSRFSAVSVIAATVVLAVVAVATPLSLSRLSMPTAPSSSGSAGEQRSLDATPSAPAPSVTAHSTPQASPRGLTEAEAVEAARRAAGQPDLAVVAAVSYGPARQVLPRQGFEWADVPSEDTWVWLVNLSDGGPPLGQEGSFVVLDYFDGTIYGVQDWIS